MRSSRSWLLGIAVTIGFLVGSSSLRAQPRLAGTYECTSIRVGKRTLPCSSPPLTLNSDGSYRIWVEKGTYTVLGKYLVLSESKKRGPGQLRRGREIVFEYYLRGKKYKVTFRRRERVPPGSAVI